MNNSPALFSLILQSVQTDLGLFCKNINGLLRVLIVALYSKCGLSEMYSLELLCSWYFIQTWKNDSLKKKNFIVKFSLSVGLKVLHEQHQWFGLSKVQIKVRVNEVHSQWEAHSGLAGHKIRGLLFYKFQQKMETWQKKVFERNLY